MERAHPRSRGENTSGSTSTRPVGGASPLTRGKPNLPVHDSHRSGRIPAHAGKTPGSHSTGLSAWAHPRSRGENMVVMRAFPSCQGASPLTRGKQVRVKEFETGKGRIPAHAGKTNFAELKQLIDRAHPRSRGENPRAAIASALATGASPLTRGKLIGGRRKVGAGRRIPAHAGKTTAPSWRSPPSWAHPRSRGENVGDNWAHMTCGGASPLTRGKPTCRTL